MYKKEQISRIVKYKEEDEVLTPNMINAGILVLNEQICDQQVLVTSIYQSMRASRPKYSATDIARFWQKVKIGDDNDCWLWIGSTKSRGKRGDNGKSRYGKIFYRGKHIYAHTMSYEIANGSLPKCMVVCHSCDNPPCCNPNHLWAGTIGDNIRDASTKGLLTPGWVPGSKNGQAKLKEVDVLEIRRRYSEGVTITEMSKEYVVTVQAISLICRRVNWRHI